MEWFTKTSISGERTINETLKEMDGSLSAIVVELITLNHTLKVLHELIADDGLNITIYTGEHGNKNGCDYHRRKS